MNSDLRCCPICGKHDLFEFFKRQSVPVHQNLIFSSYEKAVKAELGTLAMNVCNGCGFIFNAAYDKAKLSYCENYDNTQTHSGYFLDYLMDLANYLLHDERIKNSNIIEIGCGKGMFLHLLLDNKNFGNTGIGYDPSYVGPESCLNDRLHFRRCFFGKDSTETGDVIICRHVIEHVPDPLALLKTIRTALNKIQARVYIETPCVEWILRNNVIWDFFYEHCSLFSAETLANILNRAGFSVKRVKQVFGGQYLWLEGNTTAVQRSTTARPNNLKTLAKQFSLSANNLHDQWLSRISALKKHGKVAIWGAGAKGSTFVHFIDPHNELIDCLIDLNPNKIGQFVSGTGHLIIGPGDLAKQDIRTAILMNPNYLEENKKIISGLGLKLNLIAG